MLIDGVKFDEVFVIEMMLVKIKVDIKAEAV